MPARPITPPQFVRQHILRMNVAEMADALGVSSARITGYEIAGLIPDHHHDRIMELAKERNVRLRPKWLAEVPWDPAAGVPQ